MKVVRAFHVLVLMCVGAPMAEASFSEKCPDIPTCAKVVGTMLDEKYIYLPDEMKGKVEGTPNLELTAGNAELLFTQMLHMQGYSRVPTGQPRTYQIMKTRDARDSAIPLFKADQKSNLNLPNTWDIVTLQYQATHKDAVEYMARSARSFMPANSRIIPSELSGQLLLTDAAINLRKLVEILRGLDQKPTAEMKRRWERGERENARPRGDGPPGAGGPSPGHGRAPGPEGGPGSPPPPKPGSR
ncbi:MAG: hypothetical protein IT285_11235 [Bdellovibrionales bacterium]|nr:hypothetical protein [Bdellovibrionales bacterium]